jgi:hypothetical protein
MNSTARTILVLLTTALSSLPLAAWSQARPLDASEKISRIIYSDLSKPEMLDQLAAFVRIGDKLEEFPARTGVELGFCFGGGPGVEDCHLSNGLQLVADPDGVVQIIRRDARTVDGKAFPEMSISTHILRWKDYARGYPE